jgi:hypothetical protein
MIISVKTRKISIMSFYTDPKLLKGVVSVLHEAIKNHGEGW